MTTAAEILTSRFGFVVEFPGSRFNGRIAPALADLVDRDLIRALDLLVLKKDSEGTL